MGQTSKMIGQYTDDNIKETKHTIIEADKDWIDFFRAVNGKGSSKIELLEYEMKLENDIEVRTFSGFSDRL